MSKTATRKTTRTVTIDNVVYRVGDWSEALELKFCKWVRATAEEELDRIAGKLHPDDYLKELMRIKTNTAAGLSRACPAKSPRSYRGNSCCLAACPCRASQHSL
jgi:hypothetical protein